MGEHKTNPTALAARMGMIPGRRLQPAFTAVNVTVGHDGSQLVIQYSQKLDHITYTPEQAKAHLEQLHTALERLEAHLAQEKLNTLTVEAPPNEPEAA